MVCLVFCNRHTSMMSLDQEWLHTLHTSWGARLLSKYHSQQTSASLPRAAAAMSCFEVSGFPLINSWAAKLSALGACFQPGAGLSLDIVWFETRAIIGCSPWWSSAVASAAAPGSGAWRKRNLWRYRSVLPFLSHLIFLSNCLPLAPSKEKCLFVQFRRQVRLRAPILIVASQSFDFVTFEALESISLLAISALVSPYSGLESINYECIGLSILNSSAITNLYIFQFLEPLQSMTNYPLWSYNSSLVIIMFLLWIAMVSASASEAYRSNAGYAQTQ